MGCVHVRSYEKGLVRAARLDTLREHKRGSIHRCKYVEQVTSSRRSAPLEALADLVTQHDKSSSFPFHVTTTAEFRDPRASVRNCHRPFGCIKLHLLSVTFKLATTMRPSKYPRIKLTFFETLLNLSPRDTFAIPSTKEVPHQATQPPSHTASQSYSPSQSAVC
jgi:hypothetical protein